MHRSTKPFLIFNFTFLIVILPFAFCLLPSSQAQYADGDGSPEFPFQIAEPNQLIYMSQHPEHWGLNFILTADLNMNLADPNTFTTALIAPSVSNTFSGVFDGYGYTISNLTIDTVGTGEYYLGLFGYIESSNAEVKNLGLEDATINGGDFSYGFGVLCGRNDYGNISNCYSTGSITGGDHYGAFGGLCGLNQYGSISNCYAIVSVTSGDSSSSLGGLCGRNYQGSIINCYAKDLVNGGIESENIGGLCGVNNEGNISNCYSTGSVTGGIDSQSLGGLCGNNDSGSISNCFWDIQTSGIVLSDGGTGLTTEQMMKIDMYYAWGLYGNEGIWTINDGYDYPHLTWENQGGTPIISPQYLSDILEGTGEPDDPYLIYTAKQLVKIGFHYLEYDKHYKLMADINMNLVDPNIFNTAPIAPDISSSYSHQGTLFSGTFDGNNHIISNLTIDTAGADNNFLGLFGWIDGYEAKIINLGLEKLNIIGVDDSRYIGGLCGNNNEGSISNCHVSGTVTGGNDSDYLGGLCGKNSHGHISNCYSTGSVTGGDDSRYLGGLCGGNTGDISNCFSKNSVNNGDGTGSYYLGGLCGRNTGDISNSFATGSVAAGNNSHFLGGLCGYHGDGSFISYDSSIISCFATGSVTGGDSCGSLGGLCGRFYDGILNNCYATGKITGGDDSDNLGGLIGYIWAANINKCFATGVVTGGNNSEKLGGLCGHNNIGAISNCYASGSVSGGIGYLGGLCGSNDSGNFSNCYFLNTAGPDNGWGTPLTDSEMKQQGSFNGWDFLYEITDGTSETWIIYDEEYPSLFCFNPAFIPYNFIGQGTGQDPYLIYNPYDLGAIWQHYNRYFRLENDIDLTGMTWSVAVIPGFDGVFDGNSHSISNLKISGGSYLGFIGASSNNAEILNLGVENVDITSGDNSRYLGGLSGRNDGNYRNSYTTGSITTGEYSRYLGGMCGRNSGSVSTCYSICSITGGYNSDYLGGLCGFKYSGIISNCYASGSVTGGYNSDYLGGLCGDTYYYGSISNCYAAGSVSGKYDLGGLVGCNRCTISNCYATGSVSGYDYLGGLVGYNYGSISGGYFLHPTDGGGPINGYGEPLYNSEMKIQPSFVNWDFVGEEDNGTDDHWQLCIDGYDYPRLAWQFINPADFLIPGRVDNHDLFVLTHDWLTTDSPCCDIAPVNIPDGIVNLFDYIEFSRYWLNEISP